MQLSEEARVTPTWVDERLLLFSGLTTGRIGCGLSEEGLRKAPLQHVHARNPFEMQATGGSRYEGFSISTRGPSSEYVELAEFLSKADDCEPMTIHRFDQIPKHTKYLWEESRVLSPEDEERVLRRFGISRGGRTGLRVELPTTPECPEIFSDDWAAIDTAESVIEEVLDSEVPLRSLFESLETEITNSYHFSTEVHSDDEWDDHLSMSDDQLENAVGVDDPDCVLMDWD